MQRRRALEASSDFRLRNRRFLAPKVPDMILCSTRRGFRSSKQVSAWCELTCLVHHVTNIVCCLQDANRLLPNAGSCDSPMRPTTQRRGWLWATRACSWQIPETKTERTVRRDRRLGTRPHGSKSACASTTPRNPKFRPRHSLLVLLAHLVQSHTACRINLGGSG